MKRLTAEITLAYWQNVIREDWSELSKLGRTVIFLPWLIRSTIMWFLLPLSLPEFFFRRSKLFANLKKIYLEELKKTQNFS
jgi:hypothetical protein